MYMYGERQLDRQIERERKIDREIERQIGFVIWFKYRYYGNIFLNVVKCFIVVF